MERNKSLIILTIFLVSILSLNFLEISAGNNTVTNETLLDIYFIDENKGFACGTNGVILRTLDGGRNWDTLNSGTTTDFWEIHFISEQIGFVTGWKRETYDGFVFKTTNGGDSWFESFKILGQPLYAIDFINNTYGFTVGGSTPGKIYRTIDGGISWAHIVDVGDALLDIKFINETHGWVVGFYGTIAYTFDSGLTWNSYVGSPLYSLFSITFSNNSEGWIFGEKNTTLHTTDCGISWSNFSMPSSLINSTFTDASFIDTLHGWVVGDNGLLIHTSDGGQTWTVQLDENNTLWTDLLYPPDLTAVYFHNVTHGWAVGEFGTIIFTTNGGKNWYFKESLTQYTWPWYYSVFIIAAAVGVSAFVLVYLKKRGTFKTPKRYQRKKKKLTIKIKKKEK